MTLGLKENESLEGEGLGAILGWDVETLGKVGFGYLYLIQFSWLLSKSTPRFSQRRTLNLFTLQIIVLLPLSNHYIGLWQPNFSIGSIDVCGLSILDYLVKESYNLWESVN